MTISKKQIATPTVYWGNSLFNAWEQRWNNMLVQKGEDAGLGGFLPQRDGFEFANIIPKIEMKARAVMGQDASAQDIGHYISYFVERLIANTDVFQVLNNIKFHGSLDGLRPDDGLLAELMVASIVQHKDSNGDRVVKPILITRSDMRTEKGGHHNPMLNVMIAENGRLFRHLSADYSPETFRDDTIQALLDLPESRLEVEQLPPFLRTAFEKGRALVEAKKSVAHVEEKERERALSGAIDKWAQIIHMDTPHFLPKLSETSHTVPKNIYLALPKDNFANDILAGAIHKALEESLTEGEVTVQRDCDGILPSRSELIGQYQSVLEMSPDEAGNIADLLETAVRCALSYDADAVLSGFDDGPTAETATPAVIAAVVGNPRSATFISKHGLYGGAHNPLNMVFVPEQLRLTPPEGANFGSAPTLIADTFISKINRTPAVPVEKRVPLDQLSPRFQAFVEAGRLIQKHPLANVNVASDVQAETFRQWKAALGTLLFS